MSEQKLRQYCSEAPLSARFSVDSKSHVTNFVPPPSALMAPTNSETIPASAPLLLDRPANVIQRTPLAFAKIDFGASSRFSSRSRRKDPTVRSTITKIRSAPSPTGVEASARVEISGLEPKEFDVSVVVPLGGRHHRQHIHLSFGNIANADVQSGVSIAFQQQCTLFF